VPLRLELEAIPEIPNLLSFFDELLLIVSRYFFNQRLCFWSAAWVC